MEEAVAAALEEISYEGTSGCPVSRLWELLQQRLPLGGFNALTHTLKQHIWMLLLSRPRDVTLHTTSAAGPSHGSSDNSSPTLNKVDDASKYDTYESAEDADLSLLASEEMRFAVLGVYDAQEGRFQLSQQQLRALEMVARTRTRGSVQSDLANTLKILHRNFFYVTKHLQRRGLIVKNPVMVPCPTSLSGFMTTNILHLTRFAPNVSLAPGQVFKVMESTEPGGAPEVAGSASYTIHDDSPWLKQVCQVLASTEEKVVVEYDLKSLLGFRFQKGHRLWRRIRVKLEQSGNIECFPGSVNNKTVTCVRLLKDWQPEGVPGEEEADDAEEEDEGERVNNTLAEVSFDRQLLELVVQAGPAGITTTELFTALQMNAKTNLHRLSDASKRYGIVTKVENVGKTIQNRLYAPQYLLDGEPPLALPLPQGSSMVRKSRSLTIHKNVLALPSLISPPALPALEAAATPGAAAGVGAPGAGASSTDGAQAADAAGPAAPAAAATGAASAAAAATAVIDAHQGAAADAEADTVGGDEAAARPLLLEGPPAGEDGTGGERALSLVPASDAIVEATATDTRAFTKARVTTGLSDNRMRRIEERLTAQGFVIRNEMRSFLLNYEQEHQILGPEFKDYRGPDRKTLERLIQRIEKTGQARRVLITLPTPTQSGVPRTVEALLRSDIPFNADTTAAIQAYSSKFDREIRQKSYKHKFTRPEDITVLESVARLRPEAKRKDSKVQEWSQNAMEMVENGFIPARMLRVRLLHYLICKLVGLAGCTVAEPDAGGLHLAPRPATSRLPGQTNFDMAAVHPAGVFQFAQRSEAAAPKVAPAVQVEEDGGAEEPPPSTHVITVRQLWEAMPMPVALQVVGTRKSLEDMPGLLDKLGEAVGAFDAEQQAAIFDSGCRKRLLSLMDVLKRMNLVRLAVKTTWASVEETGHCVVHVAQEGEFEEPVDAADAEDEDLPADEGGFHKRRLKFDLTQEDQYEEFWQRLEAVFGKERSSADDALMSCFPCTTTPEVLGKKVWHCMRFMNFNQWMQLQTRLNEAGTNLNWQTCQQIAADLKITYQQVLRASYDKKRRYRLEMLRSGQPRPVFSASATQPARGKGRRLRGQADAQALTDEQRAEITKARTAAWRKRAQEKKRKKRGKDKGRVQGTSRDRMLQSSMHLFDGLQGGEGGSGAPGAMGSGMGDELDGLHASALPMRLETLQRRRYIAAQRSWSMADDQKLLHTYVKWRVLLRNTLTFGQMPGWPASPRQCQQRIFFMLRKQRAFTRQLRMLCDQLRQHLLQLHAKEAEEAEAAEQGPGSKRRMLRGPSSSDLRSILEGQEVGQAALNEEDEAHVQQQLEEQWQRMQAAPGPAGADEGEGAGSAAAAAARDKDGLSQARDMLGEILATAEQLVRGFPRSHRIVGARSSLSVAPHAEMAQLRNRLSGRQDRGGEAGGAEVQEDWVEDGQEEGEADEESGLIHSARQLLQRWHAQCKARVDAAGATLDPPPDPSRPPAPDVAAAMDSIRSLLYLAHKQPPLPAAAAGALLDVLPAATMWAALEMLHLQGCFKRLGMHAYKLSRAFLTSLADTGFPDQLFAQVVEVKASLCGDQGAPALAPGITRQDPSTEAVAAGPQGPAPGTCNFGACSIGADAAVEGALVCQVLEEVAAGRATLAVSHMRYRFGAEVKHQVRLQDSAAASEAPLHLEADIDITWLHDPQPPEPPTHPPPIQGPAAHPPSAPGPPATANPPPAPSGTAEPIALQEPDECTAPADNASAQDPVAGMAGEQPDPGDVRQEGVRGAGQKRQRGAAHADGAAGEAEGGGNKRARAVPRDARRGPAGRRGAEADATQQAAADQQQAPTAAGPDEPLAVEQPAASSPQAEGTDGAGDKASHTAPAAPAAAASAAAAPTAPAAAVNAAGGGAAAAPTAPAAAANAGGGGGGAAAAAPAAPAPAAGAAASALRPWVDHKGELNGPYWEALVTKMMGTVISRPGIPDTQLFRHLDMVLSEANAQELLQSLVQSGCVRVETRSTPARASLVPRLLQARSCAGAPATPGAQHQPATARRFVFPVLQDTFGCWKRARPVVGAAAAGASSGRVVVVGGAA